MKNTNTVSAAILRVRSLPAAVAHLAPTDSNETDATVALGLGLSLFRNADSNEEPAQLSNWFDRGLDANLIPAARLFGLFLRELHPASAAVGLTTAAEFQQHFDASYTPLIRRALEHSQPVLAWADWLPSGGRCWGIITNTIEKTLGFEGIVPAIDSEPRTFSTPATQVYVAERTERERPPRETILKIAPANLMSLRSPHPFDQLLLESGPTAFDTWIHAIEQGRMTAASCRELAAAVLHLRRSTLEFLSSMRVESGGPLDRLANEIRRTVTLLGDVASSTEWTDDKDRLACARRLEEVRNHEQPFAKLIFNVI